MNDEFPAEEYNCPFVNSGFDCKFLLSESFFSPFYWLTKKTFDATLVILSTGLGMWLRQRKSRWIHSDINAAVHYTAACGRWLFQY